MGKTSFNNTSDLINNLSEKIKELNNGKLSLNELDALVESSKELYEQLIILRFKAYDKFGEPQQNKPIPVEKPIEFTPVEKPIEIVPDIPVVEKTAPEEIPFDFSDITSMPAEQPINVPTPKVEEPIEKPEPKVISKPTLPVSKDNDEDEEGQNGKSGDPSNSLNDIFRKDEDQSLRKIFQNSPISDIKAQISIAKKFEYISSMFNNDSHAYEEAIDFLNTAANGHEAKLKLNSLSEKYNWDLEDKSIMKFVELVERRHI